VNFLVNTLNAFSYGRQHIGRIMCEGSRNLGASKKDSKQKVGSVRFLSKVRSLLHCLPGSEEGAKTSEN
jgi:hypothetical protein